MSASHTPGFARPGQAALLWPAASALAAALLMAPMLPAAAGSPARLVVFEAPGCAQCRQFREEALPEYWGSPASLELPIQVIDMAALGTGGHPLKARIATLPTFVVMQDGREVARLSGYPGKEGFRAMVEEVRRALAAAPE